MICVHTNSVCDLLLNPFAISPLSVTILLLIVNGVFSDDFKSLPLIVFNSFHDFAKSFCGDQTDYCNIRSLHFSVKISISF